jgi:hypothetical protein
MDTDRLQKLKLAFAMDFAYRIVDADHEESYEEFQLLGEIFPRALLEQAGFLDNGALNATWRQASEDARAVMPTLDLEDRREVFALLHAASSIDELDAREVAVLASAGAALGLTDDQVTELIAELELSR